MRPLDTAMAAHREPESKPLDLRVGDIYKNGIYIGTHDEKHVFVMQSDLIKDMTYLEAVKTVAALGDGWQMPTKEQFKFIIAQKDKIPGLAPNNWYWSCTEHRVNSSSVWLTRFSDGVGVWLTKDFLRLSCRPVRVEALSI